MKRKFLIFFLALICVFACAVALAACIITEDYYGTYTSTSDLAGDDIVIGKKFKWGKKSSKYKFDENSDSIKADNWILTFKFYNNHRVLASVPVSWDRFEFSENYDGTINMTCLDFDEKLSLNTSLFAYEDGSFSYYSAPFTRIDGEYKYKNGYLELDGATPFNATFIDGNLMYTCVWIKDYDTFWYNNSIHSVSITTAEQLQNLNLYDGGVFYLENDIILPTVKEGQSNFTPLFDEERPFNGTFYGRGHKIVNLTIYNASSPYAALFGCIGENGIVYDLNLENLNIQGTKYIGGIAGYSLGTISNCQVKGNISQFAGNAGDVFIGGIVGKMKNRISGCISYVSIECNGAADKASIGGVVGCIEIDFNISGQVLKCQYFGDIKVNADGNCCRYLGGIIGQVKNNHGNTTINSCFFWGSIAGSSSDYVGGIIGYLSGSAINISEVFNSGKISTSGGDNSGSVGETTGRRES